MPAIAKNVPLHPKFSNSACTIGLMINSPPPGPIAISPRLNERHFTKYLGTAMYVTIKIQLEPKPNKAPYVKYMTYRFESFDVIMRLTTQNVDPTNDTIGAPNR